MTVVDRGLKDPSIQDLYVAGNNPELGRVAGEYMVDNLKQGNVVVIRGLPIVIDEERQKLRQGARRLRRQGPRQAVRQLEPRRRLQGHAGLPDQVPEDRRRLGQDDDMAVGVLEAIQQAKREDIKFVLGGAGMKDMIKKVMDGDKMIPVDVSLSAGDDRHRHGSSRRASSTPRCRCAAPT